MAVQEQSIVQVIRPVAFDLYRDIHKGIRAELFAVTGSAGAVDPSDAANRADLAQHVRSVVDLLVRHAEHEDGKVQPSIEAHLPDLAETIAADHIRLERRIEAIAELAAATMNGAPGRARDAVHAVYIELASFTSSYLAHQDLEERVVMPALERAIGFDAVLEIHVAIMETVTPEEMAATLPMMLPAMNVDDRVDMLGAMRAGAPAEAFDAIWGLAKSALSPAERSATASRLGLA